MRTTFFLTLAAACAVIAAPAPSEKDLAERSADIPQAVDAPLWARADNSSASNSTSDNSNNNNSNNNKNSNKNNNNNNNNVQITEITETETVIEQNSKTKEETLFEKKVTKLVVKNQSSNNKKNDKRAKNAKSKDNTKTTVITVVQEIIEVKQDGSKGKRYAMSKITANAGQNATQSAQMTDAQAMTIGACAANATDVATATAADASATGAVAAGATADVAAPYLQSNQTQLLDSGAAAPGAAADVMLMDDSASDVASDELNQC